MSRGAHSDKNLASNGVEECSAIFCTFEILVFGPMLILIITIMVMSFIRNPAGGFGYMGNRGIGILLFFGWVEFNERWKIRRLKRDLKRSRK